MRAPNRLFASLLPALAALAHAPLGLAADPLPPGIQVRPTPAWVAPRAFDVTSPVDDERAARGVYVILRDLRVHLGPGTVERYSRYVEKATSPAGVEALAEVLVDFEPDQQTLTLHAARIQRGGATLDALRDASIRLVQQETDLVRRVYQGTVTAYVVLPDVRPGDVLDVSYSVAGTNPILEGRHAGAISLATGAPARALHAEVVVDPARRSSLVWAGKDGAPPPLPDASAPPLLRWLVTEAAPEPSDDRVPAWYWGPRVELSELGTWADVVAWGLRQYAPGPLPANLAARLDELRRDLPDRDARALAAVRFVQDDVRYLSIATGPHSHRPEAPGRVLEQRLGDCKDKTLLLVTMLRELGFDAAPALVHTELGHHVLDAVPSPHAFDHVLVNLRDGGRERWIDPTWTHQGGTLWTQAEPAVGAALVLRPDTQAITPLPEPKLAAPGHDMRKEYAAGPGGDVSLTVTTHIAGEDADAWRADLARSSRAELAESFLNYYVKEHPGAHAAAPLEVRDERERNVIELVERYALPHLWESPRWEIVGESLGGFLEIPRIAVRRLPLDVHHPVWRREEHRVPRERARGLDEGTTRVEGVAFEYTRRVASEGDAVVVSHEYRSRAGEVPPGAIDDHLAKLAEARALLVVSAQLQATPDEAVEGGFDGAGAPSRAAVLWGALGVVALALGVPGALLLRIAWRRRASASHPRGAPGEVPSTPLVVESTEELEARARAWRCACGRAFGDDAAAMDWSEVRLGDRTLHAVRVTCSSCGASLRRYVELPPARRTA
jgi:transglutaminase-like putative cysteine protease